MSLTLDESKPTGLTIKTCGIRFEIAKGTSKRREQIVMLGDYEIPMSDFCAAIEYVLSNTDLDPNDPRIGLVERIQRSNMVQGYNAKAGIDLESLRYEIQG